MEKEAVGEQSLKHSSQWKRDSSYPVEAGLRSPLAVQRREAGEGERCDGETPYRKYTLYSLDHVTWGS